MRTFSKLTPLEAQLLEALQLLTPLPPGIKKADREKIEKAIRKAIWFRDTPQIKPYTLEPSTPVIYQGESYTFAMNNRVPCLCKCSIIGHGVDYYYGIDWSKVITFQEDSINNYKAYLKKHGIKKRVTKNIRYFDYTLHLKVDKNKKR